MIQTDKRNGLVELSVSDEANILHRVGSAEYPEIRRATVRAEDASAWEEIELPAFTKAEYDAKVAELIRERYTASEEFAVHRKVVSALLRPEAVAVNADGVPIAVVEFNAYNTYAEQCKAEAKQLLTKQAGASVMAEE